MKQCLNCENEFESKRSRAKFCCDLCRATYNQNIKNKKEIVVKIYELINPIDNLPFYVGKTVMSLETRLNAHIKDKEGSAKKREIIKSILDNGVHPIISEIESHTCLNEQDELDALLQEDFWINKYKNSGIELTNVSWGFAPRLTSNYSKYSNKGDTRSYRFNEHRINFVQEKLKLKTRQEVLDYLIDEFWFKHNSGFLVPLNTNSEPPKVEYVSKPKIRRSFENYQGLLLDCETTDEYFKLKEEIENADNLTTKQKNLLLKR